jgi:two-component system cell cycle response regulator
MPGKLLIVDSIATNRIVMKVRLRSAFYEVFQASNPAEATAVLQAEKPDLVLISAHDDKDAALGFCRHLRSDPETAQVPIVVLSVENEKAFRVAALRAGANDVLVRPLDDMVLLARLRSLLRARETQDQLDLRKDTAQVLGLAETPAGYEARASVQVTTACSGTAREWQRRLAPLVPYDVSANVLTDTLRSIENNEVPDVFVIALDAADPETALRLLAEIRARAKTRFCSVLAVLSGSEQRTQVDALDLGAHDLMVSGFDADEMALRISTLIQQKKLSDRLRANVRHGLEAAVTDPLTGLFNRRYALPHLSRIADQARRKSRNFAVMMADIDHFKSVNDRFGHTVGDAVLAETARRLRENLRAIDLVARVGGEEFLIVQPDISLKDAKLSAARLCSRMRSAPISVARQNLEIPVTLSIGVAMGGKSAAHNNVDDLLGSADRALYQAKAGGRDQALFHTAA